MADDRRTRREEGEEEEDQEGKATDSTISARGSASLKASQTVSDSDQNDPPDSGQSDSQNVSPLATQSGSEYTRSGSPSLRKIPSKSEEISTASHSLGGTPSRRDGLRKTDLGSGSPGSSLRKSPSISLGTSSDIQSKTPIEGAATPLVGASSRSTELEDESLKVPSETEREYRLQDGQTKAGIAMGISQPQSTSNFSKNDVVSRKATAKAPRKEKQIKGKSRDRQGAVVCGTSRLFERRSPFIHNPPYPEERRPRITHPQCPRDYIINLREDLADFQESHGLPRSRDYSFQSLGLSLAQETGRAIYCILLMLTELFPVIAIVSLILRFALDKVIEILETDGAVPRLKKAVLFFLQIIIIMVPLWILIATIIIPLFYLILSIFRRLFHLSGRKSAAAKTSGRPDLRATSKGKKKKMSFI